MSKRRIITEDMSDERKFSRIELAIDLLIEENKALRRKVAQQEKSIEYLLSGYPKEADEHYVQVH